MKSKYFIIAMLLVAAISTVIGASEVVDLRNIKNVKLDSNGGIPISIQDYTGNIVSFYLTYPMQITNLTYPISSEDTIVTLNNITNCAVGQALDIYDNNNYYQGLIKAINGNNVTLTPEIDSNFNDLNNTIAKCGITNMNVNGLTQEYEFYINPPKQKSWHIESIGMSFSDNLDWDMATFGSRSQLDNGFVVEVEDGILKELFLIYNNEGFLHRGGVVQNVEKAPAGVYGFGVDLEFESKYGSVLELNGEDNQKLIAEINDDLTSQTSIRFIVRGHYADE